MTINPQIKNYKPVKQSDAELFVQDHWDRFHAWLFISTAGCMVHMDLVANDAIYDRFTPPEIAALIGRISSPFEFTFVRTDEDQCVCIMSMEKLFELMGAANDLHST